MTEPYEIGDENYFATLNRTDAKAMKHLKEKPGVVRDIVFNMNMGPPGMRMGKPGSDSPEGGVNRTTLKVVTDRHYRPEHPRKRNENFLEELCFLISEI